ncbi:MAG: hypothetical protein LBI53_08185 [Candidatus Peribacteria bacterium]|jgi:hypothetical protein|nr:hypothetical protein [Candidatus Peribacteria bacterium]
MTGDVLLDGENIINEMMSGGNGFGTLESLINQLSGCFSGYITNNTLTCN